MQGRMRRRNLHLELPEVHWLITLAVGQGTDIFIDLVLHTTKAYQPFTSQRRGAGRSEAASLPATHKTSRMKFNAGMFLDSGLRAVYHILHDYTKALRSCKSKASAPRQRRSMYGLAAMEVKRE
jgi:hypothetical protein